MTSEATYTKNDVMAALAKCEQQVGPEEIESGVTEIKAFNLGANVMAEALLGGLDSEDVREKKAEAIFGIVIDKLLDYVLDKAKKKCAACDDVDCEHHPGDEKDGR